MFQKIYELDTCSEGDYSNSWKETYCPSPSILGSYTYKVGLNWRSH